MNCTLSRFIHLIGKRTLTNLWEPVNPMQKSIKKTSISSSGKKTKKTKRTKQKITKKWNKPGKAMLKNRLQNKIMKEKKCLLPKKQGKLLIQLKNDLP